MPAGKESRRMEHECADCRTVSFCKYNANFPAKSLILRALLEKLFLKDNDILRGYIIYCKSFNINCFHIDFVVIQAVFPFPQQAAR